MDIETLVNKLEKHLVKHGEREHEKGVIFDVKDYVLWKGKLMIKFCDGKCSQLSRKDYIHYHSLSVQGYHKGFKHLFYAKKLISGDLRIPEIFEDSMLTKGKWNIHYNHLSDYNQRQLRELVR